MIVAFPQLLAYVIRMLSQEHPNDKIFKHTFPKNYFRVNKNSKFIIQPGSQ